ncbi:hypothetical protein Y032_0117g671 [Ancylostoma ceylanicum]|uniref:Secreted protein n=1 Tax=Ancylostoma ceylanicum TaxID=53326 RepID=A0A016TBY8_9BILA|nr:hypothetical protein Y032_0117g671 [Ancylostoma ceylanicum]
MISDSQFITLFSYLAFFSTVDNVQCDIFCCFMDRNINEKFHSDSHFDFFGADNCIMNLKKTCSTLTGGDQAAEEVLCAHSG